MTSRIPQQTAAALFMALSLAISASLLSSIAAAQQADEAEGEQGVEILTRGPVHEAFVETVTFDPEAGIVVPRMPPEAIEELPPDQRPEGENVAWIPGYWAWDDEREDFLWVSGIWRSLPPGRQWVPGYWAESAEGAQWTAGYWADAAAEEIEYLPEPPATVEAGPNVEAASDDESWIPGCWVWNESRYAWRPGYWETVQPNWVWVPAYYVWTPGGYVFVDGYWDYSVDRRGLVFAPVYFDRSVYTRRGFSYSPATVINPAVFVSHLFARPNYQHYYFGDYYAPNYAHSGFHSWFSFHNHHGYDPHYAQQRWRNRKDRDWDDNQQAEFQHRRDDENSRPPRTWADQGQRGDKGQIMAASLAQLAKSQDSPLRLQQLDKQARQKLTQGGQAFNDFRQERRQRESQGVDAANRNAPDRSRRTRVKVPTSPIVAQQADQPSEEFTPPQRPKNRQFDDKVEPRKRTAGSEPVVRDPQAEPRRPMPRTGTDKPVAGTEPKKPTPRTDSDKPDPRAEPKKPMPRTEPNKPEPRAEPKKPMPRTGPNKPEPSAEPKKPMPRTEPKKPEPRVEPKKPQPRAEPKQPPMPKAEPKQPPMPRAEPKQPAVPRAEPKQPPMPRAEPKQPTPQPGAGPKDKS